MRLKCITLLRDVHLSWAVSEGLPVGSDGRFIFRREFAGGGSDSAFTTSNPLTLGVLGEHENEMVMPGNLVNGRTAKDWELGVSLMTLQFIFTGARWRRDSDCLCQRVIKSTFQTGKCALGIMLLILNLAKWDLKTIGLP